MSLRVIWGGIAAYFFLFWFAVEDLGLAVACTFFLVVIGVRMTFAMIKAPASEDRCRPEQPLPANQNQPPRP